VPGAAFLGLSQYGLLPWQFAVVGGIGDIVVGLLAPAAAMAARSKAQLARAAVLFFSVVGFVDLAFVLRGAYASTLADPSSMHLIRALPLGLLPTFAVPLMLAAH